MSVVFVGGGHIAEALIGGALKAGRDCANIAVAERDKTRREHLRSKYGVGVVNSAGELPQSASALILAVRPADAKDACAQIKTHAPLVSVVAGLTLAQMIEHAPKAKAHIRAMPNTPALIGMGMTVLCAPNAPQTAKDSANEIFRAVGEVLWTDDEEMISAATAISGSGPGYVFYFAEALIEAAQEMGFNENDAKLLALQTLSGASMMARQSEKSAKELRENVAVPGGTTEQGINQMRARDFPKIITAAAAAARKRARELS